VNEGLAVHAAQGVAPGFDAADYFGYPAANITGYARWNRSFAGPSTGFGAERSGPSAPVSLGRHEPLGSIGSWRVIPSAPATTWDIA